VGPGYDGRESTGRVAAIESTSRAPKDVAIDGCEHLVEHADLRPAGQLTAASVASAAGGRKASSRSATLVARASSCNAGAARFACRRDTFSGHRETTTDSRPRAPTSRGALASPRRHGTVLALVASPQPGDKRRS